MSKDKEKTTFLDEINEDLEKLYNMINDVDELYMETKKHFDSVRSSPSRGSLTFIEKQTTNLINLKNSKVNIYKEILNSKKNSYDLDLKKQRLEIAEGQDNGTSITPEIIDLINSINSSNNKKTEEVKDEHIVTISEDLEKDIDAELESQLSEEFKESSKDIYENEKSITDNDEEGINESVDIEEEDIEQELEDMGYLEATKVCDVEGNFYLIEGFDIIEELGPIEEIVSYEDIEGIQCAVTEDGSYYELIEVS